MKKQPKYILYPEFFTNIAAAARVNEQMSSHYMAIVDILGNMQLIWDQRGDAALGVGELLDAAIQAVKAKEHSNDVPPDDVVEKLKEIMLNELQNNPSPNTTEKAKGRYH